MAATSYSLQTFVTDMMHHEPQTVAVCEVQVCCLRMRHGCTSEGGAAPPVSPAAVWTYQNLHSRGLLVFKG